MRQAHTTRRHAIPQAHYPDGSPPGPVGIVGADDRGVFVVVENRRDAVVVERIDGTRETLPHPVDEPRHGTAMRRLMQLATRCSAWTGAEIGGVE